MDSKLSLKFTGYFSDYVSALSHTLLGFCLDNLCRRSCIRGLDSQLDESWPEPLANPPKTIQFTDEMFISRSPIDSIFFSGTRNQSN